MYKLEVKLKQHTPLIHFQWDQEGATLRASEVKPKLDRFIIQKLGVEEINESWWIGDGSKEALDYKMRIMANGKKIISEKLPMYFGRSDKKGILYDDVDLVVFSYNSEIIEKVKECLSEFFFYTNFGTRQSKGYGCFEVIKKKEGDEWKEWILEDKDKEKILGENFDFVYKKELTADDELINIFQIIKRDYQILKSGENYNGYTKSLLFCFAVDKMSLRWEKRKMKQIIKQKIGDLYTKNGNSAIYDTEGNQAWEDKEVYNYSFLRALLGLTTQYEFKLEGNQKAIVEVKGEIERFASPLYFKVIDKTIYIVGKEINTYILDKKFDYTYKKKDTNEKSFLDCVSNEETSPSYHFTPSEFSLLDFIKYAMAYTIGSEKLLNYVNIESHD